MNKIKTLAVHTNTNRSVVFFTIINTATLFIILAFMLIFFFYPEPDRPPCLKFETLGQVSPLLFLFLLFPPFSTSSLSSLLRLVSSYRVSFSLLHSLQVSPKQTVNLSYLIFLAILATLIVVAYIIFGLRFLNSIRPRKDTELESREASPEERRRRKSSSHHTRVHLPPLPPPPPLSPLLPPPLPPFFIISDLLPSLLAIGPLFSFPFALVCSPRHLLLQRQRLFSLFTPVSFHPSPPAPFICQTLGSLSQGRRCR